MGQIVGEAAAERGKGVGATGMGPEGWDQEGWGKGGVRGWYLYLNEVFNKTGIISSN